MATRTSTASRALMALSHAWPRHDLDGREPMFHVFNEDKSMLLASEKREEQKAIKFLFAGAIGAIRNPQAHTAAASLSEDEALEMLTICFYLFRVLELSPEVQAL